ncbi:MAG: metallophosphoesterase [Gammaproteobacteria bacterium]|nr:metallophosphoesterase [Gammaproteobacteria bacterium]
MKASMDRRSFLKGAGTLALGGLIPLNLIEVAFGKDNPQNFTFGYISDSHLTHIKGTQFVRNWDHGLGRAVAEVNMMDPKPDFVVYGGDIAQLGKKEEIDHGLEMLSAIRNKMHYVMGEHDYYLDLGKYWESQLGPQWYSFDHKGVHFVVLNSILTYPDWTYKRWPSAQERMHQMARLDNPQGSPFMVGEAQRAWLQQDLAKVSKDTPIVVLSHSPLYKIYKGWNFWTEDAEQVQALLQPFRKVTVIHGHVHQVLYNQIGNISFYAVMSTAWPWPYANTYTQAKSLVPKLTVPMNRADPFHERDATGWTSFDLANGHVDTHYQLWSNTDRTVAFNTRDGKPEDTVYQPEDKRIPPQTQY